MKKNFKKDVRQKRKRHENIENKETGIKIQKRAEIPQLRQTDRQKEGKRRKEGRRKEWQHERERR